jgi:broad specificity phosphatase PhoE
MSAQQQSPVTGVINESNVIIDFGKYEGRTVQEIAKLDPEFYHALVDEKGAGMYAIRRHRDKTFHLYLNPLAQMDV